MVGGAIGHPSESLVLQPPFVKQEEGPGPHPRVGDLVILCNRASTSIRNSKELSHGTAEVKETSGIVMMYCSRWGEKIFVTFVMTEVYCNG